MDIRFDGKRALVTGAGKGIGRGIAVKLAELGAKVHSISRTQKDLDSLKQEVPGIEVHNVDIADWDRTRVVVESIGPIDLLINNAGITNWSSFLDVTKDELENMFDINFKAVFNISQVVAKGMLEREQGGSIVNISSVAGYKAVPNHTIYCSAKAAMDQLTRAMALELGPHKITVNSVNPTIVLTELGKRGWSDPVKKGKALERIPVGRLAEVEDVVDTTLYLMSDKATMISGVIMPVDGAMTAIL